LPLDTTHRYLLYLGVDALDAGIGASLGVTLRAVLWLAFKIHALGVEVYVSWLPDDVEVEVEGLADRDTVEHYAERGGEVRKVGDARRRRVGGRADRLDLPSKGVDDGATKAAEVEVVGVEKELGLETAR
jgi:hypothetical protein